MVPRLGIPSKILSISRLAALATSPSFPILSLRGVPHDGNVVRHGSVWKLIEAAHADDSVLVVGSVYLWLRRVSNLLPYASKRLLVALKGNGYTRRGLFSSSTGVQLNADVNGAIGMLRKDDSMTHKAMEHLRSRHDIVSPEKLAYKPVQNVVKGRSTWKGTDQARKFLEMGKNSEVFA